MSDDNTGHPEEGGKANKPFEMHYQPKREKEVSSIIASLRKSVSTLSTFSAQPQVGFSCPHFSLFPSSLPESPQSDKFSSPTSADCLATSSANFYPLRFAHSKAEGKSNDTRIKSFLD